MAQSDTIRYEPELADIAVFRICKQGVVGSIAIVSTIKAPGRRALLGQVVGVVRAACALAGGAQLGAGVSWIVPGRE